MSEIDYRNHCRVCGLDQGEPIWGEDGLSPTFDICSCCGVEFGYGDHSADNCREIRKHWLEAESGCWRSPQHKPTAWSWEDQRMRIPEGYRE